MAKKKPAAQADELVDASADLAGEETDQATMPADAQPEATGRRTYTTTQSKDHDLFKCRLAKFIRDLSWAKDGSQRQEVEHVHFFHTIDSSGRDLKETNNVGGHFHEVKIIPAKDENSLPKVICGPARTWVIQGKGKNKKRVMVAPRIAVGTDNEEADEHTHEMDYLGSQRIPLRKPNVEAAKYQAEVAAKQEIRVPGIVG
jgi:hypothetical protein